MASTLDNISLSSDQYIKSVFWYRQSLNPDLLFNYREEDKLLMIVKKNYIKLSMIDSNEN